MPVRPNLPPLLLILLALLFSALADDSDDKPKPTPAPTTPAPNPYQPHDRICRDYLATFLKGTTDVRDECAGLLNAYEAGGCKSNEGDDDTNGGKGGEEDDPWKKWWHDLFGDDDVGPPDIRDRKSVV